MPWYVVWLILAILALVASLIIVPYIKQFLGVGTSYASPTDFDNQPPEPGKTENSIKNTDRIFALPGIHYF